MTLRKNLHWFIYILFLFACARQSSPTGGPKDTIPPTLIRTIPPNEAINFKSKTVELEFSEAIILNSPKEQLIITPTIGKDYKITYRKNVVKLEFEDPLLDSTTYTFNFRETVQDITEKNPVRNLSIAYSTGTYIDSLSVEGFVYDMITGKAVKDATVALHVENDTFNILLHPATYFTKTDDNGQFKISHLKPQKYFLYAFQDNNRNLIVNSRSESYGFRPEYLDLRENIKELSLGIVRLDAGQLKLTSARPYNTYFNIRTSKNLRTFTLQATDSSELSYAFGEDQANIRLYDTFEPDSIQIHLLALDSIDNVIDTTLYAKFLSRQVTPEAFNATLSATSLLAHTGQLKATLQFSKPIKEVNFDSLYFQVDSLTKVHLKPEDLTWEPIKKKLLIEKTLDKSHFPNSEPISQTRRAMRQTTSPQPSDTAKQAPAPIHELHIGRGAFISIEQDTSAQILQSIKPYTQQELSIINIEIRTEEPSFIIQLLDNKLTPLREIHNKHRVRFTDVVPGDYQIRLIIDTNKNGRWDPGNYFQEVEPEKMIYYKTADGTPTIKGVKANWEIGTQGEMFITY